MGVRAGGISYNSMVGLIPQEYQQYATMFPEFEVINQKFWDTQSYVSATTLALNGWFNTSRTGGVDVTNMTTVGLFSSPNAYLIRTVRFYVKHRALAASPASAAGVNAGGFNNIAALINTGTWTFTIGSKVYNQEPLWVLTAGGGACGSMAAAGTTGISNYYDYAQNGISDPRAVNSLSKPLFIPPMLNFYGSIVWPAAVTLTGNLDITILLDGDLLRPVQ